MASAPSVALQAAPTHRISLVRVTDGAGGVWAAEVEDLPHCSARADTPEEAVRRAWAAVEESLGQVAGDGTATSPAATTPRHSGKLLVRMPATLHDELARAAESEGVSLNQLITGVLASAVEWRGAGVASAHGRRADGSESESEETGRSRHITRVMLAANFALVLLVAVVAVGLLLTAWLD